MVRTYNPLTKRYEDAPLKQVTIPTIKSLEARIAILEKIVLSK